MKKLVTVMFLALILCFAEHAFGADPKEFKPGGRAYQTLEVVCADYIQAYHAKQMSLAEKSRPKQAGEVMLEYKQEIVDKQYGAALAQFKKDVPFYEKRYHRKFDGTDCPERYKIHVWKH